jgi:aminoglycoside phosphotransferase (APT) family kinase protein
MHPWDAEHGVDAALAQRLIGDAWPDLRGEVAYVGSGWDVDVWRIGALAVRFPRRPLGAACVDNELAVLPHVAALAIPVPRPERIAGPTAGYPARFYAHAWLPGTPLFRAREWTDDPLARLATPLGRFLGALHTTPMAQLRAAGLRDDWRGGPVRIAERGRQRVAELALEPTLAAAVRDVIETPVVEPAELVVIHGDCHAGNLLVDRGEVSGVIDWGDSAAGDRATDLAFGWSVVPPAARDEFCAAYGGVDAATWSRARLSALARHGLALLAWGRDIGDAAIVDWAERSIARILER